ncbi:plastocyanin/azurin family copper-binding protein [Roseomonas genomospecies 6]|uniref:Pseudoazurin n=1 Tax=Roseomonas genomospecies 6 TaxID=214106 RepID=A0A9W7NF98_9PROT|nr:plastocyanin/azurin family copper-binding protein [Roseomonas genomospecies 6]KAA0676019.1 pseudoazurin [Roseomonas genomospecies 6]
MTSLSGFLRAATVGAMLAATPALAAEIAVDLSPNGPAHRASQDVVEIAPGDTIRFVGAGGHRVESIRGMQPPGGVEFKGRAGQDLVVTFDKPGLYGFRCKEHYTQGEVGLIVVGDPRNIVSAAAVRHPVEAQKVFETLFRRLQAEG